MKQIDEYLDSLYKEDKSKETISLKLEMKEHLLESVKELKDEGYSQEEAIEISIDRFDGGIEMEDELQGIIKQAWFEKNNIKNKITSFFRNILIVSVVVYACLTFYNNKMIDYHTQIYDKVSKDLHTTIADINNPKQYKNKLDNMLNEKYGEVKQLKIYSNENNESKENLKYNYTKGNLADTIYLENSNDDLDNSNKLYFEIGLKGGLYLISDKLLLIDLFIGLAGFIGFILSKLDMLDKFFINRKYKESL
ncbi:permease prefix domain 1-containing protein [Terrisporobacter petrolearius]|uniref:permease prefix domain 1-containing protein n=1 Tax=Terrisporobacter petrolearius TaxID=1460447 RepID=UPI001D16F305|nr:permease prefix domain 1-containing protein [Terrisporobacter petrolearius]MCC3866346.1 permease prefix domain 1-containing protein [Terrisporobacter petrolearius]